MCAAPAVRRVRRHNQGLIEAVRVVVDGMSRLNAMRGPDASTPHE